MTFAWYPRRCGDGGMEAANREETAMEAVAARRTGMVRWDEGVAVVMVRAMDVRRDAMVVRCCYDEDVDAMFEVRWLLMASAAISFLSPWSCGWLWPMPGGTRRSHGGTAPPRVPHDAMTPAQPRCG